MQTDTCDERRGLPSCSNLDRLENCPASHALAKAAEAAGDAPPEDPCATAGTLIHRYLETEADADFEKLTHGDRETAETCLSQKTALVLEWIEPSGENVQHLKERRLGLTRLGTVLDVTPESTADFICTGMADLIVLDLAHRRALIVDYKTGRGEVEDAKLNKQLRGLAVLASVRWNLLTVRVAIVQPLAGAPTIADFTESVLPLAFEWLEGVCEETTKPHAPVAGDWCQYCPARVVCPALREAVTSAPDVLQVESLPAEPKAAVAALTARALELQPSELAGLLKGRRMIGWYVSAIEAAARVRLERGEPVPGYELKGRNGRRKIEDTDKAAVAVSTLLAGAEGGPQAALLRAATLRPAALQEEVQKASGRKNARSFNLTAKAAKDKLAEALGELMVTAKSKVLAEVGSALEWDGEEGE